MFVRSALSIFAAVALNVSMASAQMDLLVDAEMPVFVRLMKAQIACFQ